MKRILLFTCAALVAAVPLRAQAAAPQARRPSLRIGVGTDVWLPVSTRHGRGPSTR